MAAARQEVDPGADAAIAGVEVARVRTGRFDWIGLGWSAAAYLRARRDRFDVVHFADVHFAYACGRPFVASAFQSFRQRLTSAGGRPYHTHRRNYALRLLYYNAARRTLEPSALRRAQHLLMSSRATMGEFCDHYRLNPGRASVVYPGIELARFGDLPEKSAARAALGLPKDVPLLLFVGFASPRKGLEHLAKAFGALPPSVHLVIAGKWDAAYRKRFSALLGSNHDRVHLAGYVPDAALPLYYAAADVFVSPTLLEGFGLPIAEAMAAGLPIVTTTGGSAGEVAGEGGRIVPPGDHVALAEQLRELVGNAELRAQLGHAGRERAHRLFDLAEAAARVEAVYDRVLAPEGTP